MVEFHLSLSGAVDCQHRHPPPQTVIALIMPRFLHRLKSRREDYYWGLRRMPGLPEDTIHRRASLVGNCHVFTRKIEIGQGSLVGTHNMIVCSAQFIWIIQK